MNRHTLPPLPLSSLPLALSDHGLPSDNVDEQIDDHVDEKVKEPVEEQASQHINKHADKQLDAGNDVDWCWLGMAAYADTFDAMRAYTDSRTGISRDQIWLVEHPPVFTLGQAGNPDHLLVRTSDVPLIKTDRGGQITFHGPGQVVAYLLIDLRRRGLMVREFVQRIEQAVIETLAAYNLKGERHAGAPGIYLAEGQLAGAKIAALGLKIRHGCSYHGVSLNVAMDLRPFDNINPCGYAGLQTVDMALAGAQAPWRDVAEKLATRLSGNLPEMSPESLR